MAKVKLAKVMGCAQALSRLNNQPLSAKYALRLAALAHALETHGKVELEARKKLLKDHGAREDARGNLSMFDEKTHQPMDQEKFDAFQKQYEELLDTEVEIEPVNLSELPEMTISTADVLALEGLVVWEKPKPKPKQEVPPPLPPPPPKGRQR